MKRTKRIFLLILGSLILVGCSNSNQSDESSSTFDYTPDKFIIGIEPGSGTYQSSTQAIQAYGLDQTMTANSTSVMTQLLGVAIEEEAPIVVTGWVPHWKFEAYDLKFLDDPLNAYGQGDDIVTFVREGFYESNPGAYEIIDRFYWEIDEMQEVMIDIQNGMTGPEAGRKWVENNPDRVREWTEGVPDGDGQLVTIAHPTWDSEFASVNVVKAVLEDKGYRCITTAVEIGPMYVGVAYGSVDVMLSGWLPNSHIDYGKEYGPMMVNLGPNMEDTRTGMVVPSYVEDLNSIEDLKSY